jgi:hypothetical protein
MLAQVLVKLHDLISTVAHAFISYNRSHFRNLSTGVRVVIPQEYSTNTASVGIWKDSVRK